jgi:hypothetical protein
MYSVFTTSIIAEGITSWVLWIRIPEPLRPVQFATYHTVRRINRVSQRSNSRIKYLYRYQSIFLFSFKIEVLSDSSLPDKCFQESEKIVHNVLSSI